MEPALDRIEIIKAVARVRDECEHIEKDGWNAFHKYHYVSEAALSNAIRPLAVQCQLRALRSLLRARDSQLGRAAHRRGVRSDSLEIEGRDLSGAEMLVRRPPWEFDARHPVRAVG